MKLLLIILFFIDLIGFCFGFYTKSNNVVQGELIIGISLVLGFFIIMPLFIYYRWKNKNVKDYMLTKENILKMREYNDSKESKS